jgi:hypothetical protein
MNYPVTLKHKKSGLIVTFTAPTKGTAESLSQTTTGNWTNAESPVWVPATLLDKVQNKALKTLTIILQGS